MDGAAGFVAHDEGLVVTDAGGAAKAAVLPEVHVGATGADVVDANDDIMRVGDFGDGMVFEFGVVGAVEPDGWILEDRCETGLIKYELG